MFAATTRVAVVAAALACATPPAAPRNSGDALGDPAAGDTGGDAMGDPAPGDTPGDPGDVGGGHLCGAPVDVSMPRLWPAPGELFYLQAGLSGVVALGEAAITVWPDGRIVLVDLGNDSHSSTVIGLLNTVITAMNSAGMQRSAGSADHVILTHHHADHSDGIEGFLNSVTLSGRVVSRGYYDLVGVTASTIEKSCGALASRPGKALALCSGAVAAPCDASTWIGTYPADSCSGAAAAGLFTFAPETRIDVVAVNGFIGGDSYEDQIGQFLSENNGENARSIVAVLAHGPFRMLVNGDLTGGGSNTDPVEGFYASRLAGASDLNALGVDVLHAAHHGRNTSTSQVWANALVPADGKSRNVVMGVSEAHIRSPYQEVLDVIFAQGRLAQGRGWTTRVATLGRTHAQLINASGGHIVVRTYDQGRGYYVQAVSSAGSVLTTRRYDSVRACP